MGDHQGGVGAELLSRPVLPETGCDVVRLSTRQPRKTRHTLTGRAMTIRTYLREKPGYRARIHVIG